MRVPLSIPVQSNSVRLTEADIRAHAGIEIESEAWYAMHDGQAPYSDAPKERTSVNLCPQGSLAYSFG